MIKIYTDGACSQNGTWQGGWGTVVVENDTLLCSFSGAATETTNNAMELSAFLKALEYIYFHKEPTQQYEVLSDSAYIINCFEQKWHVNWRKNGWRNAKKEPVANKELWLEILNLYDTLNKENINFKFTKVKGHAGNKYNEMADRLAVEASK